MSFLNKNIFKTIAVLAIIILAAILFIKLVPYIIVAGLAIWLILKFTKKVDKTNKDKDYKIKNDSFKTQNTGFSNEKETIIDVDYTEVKH
ncbi:hypothetical protein [Clostridium felsineum]|uniref:Uncharacterized protein n=1 Tax=Clostridium felsineum TaxID=36839 RepID=A0A1S8LDV1_9CLOT|nr:hypothetical protein [Clostridium felsineum]URZ05226.1 hypothetical protein CLROS_005500 [Clostridium felsineum]URZ10267.1 hypothetical protein CROST_009750 [Clostridium felsineum]URZ17856.1 hypothetical protein CLFE_039110 [Clostridium felsineum DSM 794]